MSSSVRDYGNDRGYWASRASRVLRGTLLGASLCAAGCTVGPNYHRPAVPLPPSYSGATGSGSQPAGDLASLQWWQVFRDPALQQLIRKARGNNPDVKIAAARIDQLQAENRALRASYLPVVDAAGNETSQRISPIGLPKDRTSGNPAGSATIFGAQASWEIDFWGRYRRANEAARAALLAGKAAQEAVQTTLVADVASAYFNLLALDEQLRFTRGQIALRQSFLQLVTARKNAGVSAMQEVRSAQAAVENEDKVAARLEGEIADRENQLRFLTGETAGTIPRGEDLWEEQLPELGPGLPSALLTRRPDVREAEENLIAANAEIGVAESAYFPNLSLTAAGGEESTAFHNLLTENAATYLLQPQINLPVFTAGRIKADVERAKAAEMAALAAYREAVIGAFRDAADALAERTAADTSESKQRQIAEQQADAARLAGRLTQAGVTSSLDRLQAEEVETAARYQLAADREEQLSSAVQLYRVLGGGWQP